MAYVSQLEYDGTFYDIQDAVAQEKADTATSAAESAIATAEAAETTATAASETAEEAKAIAQGVAGSYSLDEIDTNATWIDGRHIFKKTVACNLGALTQGTAFTLASNVEIENFDFLINSELTQKYSAGLATVVQYALIRFQNGVLSVLPGITASAVASRYCTIYYVKTA